VPRELQEVVDFLRGPEKFQRLGAQVPKGVLLVGPPGTGKTLLARAVAGEMQAHFISVGLSDVLDMWLGESERKLHEVFEDARKRVPCVLFFDELDGLGRKRSLQRHSYVRNMVNVLLAEMDGVQPENDGVFILAATNHPWDVDAALRRPGRLDRVLLVLPPDVPAREAILRLHLKGKPVELPIDFHRLAEKAADLSGADLAHVCNCATELAMDESFRLGRTQPITFGHLEQALAEVQPSTRAWFDTARNFALFANEGGLYDDLLSYLRARRML